MCLPKFSQSQVREIERRSDTVEKLAKGLLHLLFTNDELAHGNCTKPTRPDIQRLDSDRLWAIKCKCRCMVHIHAIINTLTFRLNPYRSY